MDKDFGPNGMWLRNVQDKYKTWSTEDIKRDLQSSALPYSVIMENWQGDFNIGTMIRNANAFNAEGVYYLGKKHIDRRGAVGCQNYTDITHLDDYDHLSHILSERDYTLVGLDIGLPDTETDDIRDFVWPERPMLAFGEETSGLSSEVLKLCKHVVHIPQWGSVRSLNVGTSSGIAIFDFVTKYLRDFV